MSVSSSDTAHEGVGVFYAAAAYVIWGTMPLYWRLLGKVSALELTAHRIAWGALFVTLVVGLRGHLPRVFEALRSGRTFRILALTSVLIAVNWAIFMYSLETDQLVQASLGYYLIPVISFLLGFVFFGERMSRVRMFAVALATLGVILKTISLGYVSWIALGLALTFGVYGYFHKRVTLPALDGLLVETAILFPLSAGFVFWLFSQGEGLFTHRDLTTDALLIIGGPLTAIPLALFAAGARRVRLTTLGFLQYLSPSITLLLAIFLFGEPFTTLDMAVFGCVWLALVIAALEGRGWNAMTARPTAGAK